MKKIFTLILALVMIFTLVACGDEPAANGGDDVDVSKPATQDSGVKFTQVEKGLALDTDGRIWSFSLVEEPKVLCDAAKFTFISEGNGLCCALDENGGLWTWGMNRAGQLGDGTTTDRPTPQKILDGVKMVSAYDSNAFAIKTDGTLYQWGNGNNFTKLRDSMEDRDNILTPTAVKTDAKFQYVATAGATVAIDTDGNRYCWGAPCTTMGYGANQIDDAFDPSAAITPFSLKKIKNDTAPKGTYYFGNGTTYIIDANNTLYISGGRGSRLDPFETNGSFKTFTKVADKVAMLTKSNYGTLYIDTDGNIWGWGSSAFKLCPETTKPVQITNGIKFIDVAILSSGSTMAYALAADGSIYTFGEKNSTPTVLEVK